MKTIEEIRLENLKTLCAGFKSQRQFALHLGKSPAHVNQWFGKGVAAHSLGSTAAREIEEKCGKPRGWLDNDHARPQETQDGTITYTSAMIEG